MMTIRTHDQFNALEELIGAILCAAISRAPALAGLFRGRSANLYAHPGIFDA